MKLFLSAFFLIFSLQSFASTPCYDEKMMLESLDLIKRTFQIQYAPSEWKKQHADWDLEREIEKAKNQIEQHSKEKTLNLKTYQRIVRNFFNSTQDYHVSIQFFSTESACLPLSIKGVDGRYFVAWIDKNRIIQPIFTGDEILEFNGKPVKELISDLKKEEMGTGNEETDDGLAEKILVRRVGALGHNVPKGFVSLKVKSKNTNEVDTFTFQWDYELEQILNSNFHPVAAKGASALINELLSKRFELANWSLLRDTRPDDRSPEKNENENLHEIGGKKSYVPMLGKKIWESKPSAYFHAYLFESGENRFGYIRISSYSGDEDEVKEFARHIKLLQKHSDALVIDQVSNPGGSVFYLHALASMLTENPLIVPKHRISLTQKDVMQAVSFVSLLDFVTDDHDARLILGENISGIPVDYKLAQCFKDYFSFLINEWNLGKTLTDPVAPFGLEYVAPHPRTRYGKEILLLTDPLDFSGGDFFPAIMQDNKRATILGSRTAGAGGFVFGFTYPNLLGIAGFNYTGSIAERLDHNPIENLGVTPDIPYKISVEDLQNGYQPYKKAILNVLEQLKSEKKM